MKSTHLIVHGRVQGVFFRDNTRKKAIELGLFGYAKNLDDGTVEVVLQGNESKIKTLIDFLRKNPGISRVDDIQITDADFKKFGNFEVNH
ncbi:MAG TPA: acylphosphatase [Candidatus Nanoarchaeia archaeon]|nr:acylphosphatase [Candidatus Nanoarchaeia archaeon]